MSEMNGDQYSFGSTSKKSPQVGRKEIQKRSFVWDHFVCINTPDGRLAECNYCTKKYSGEKGTSQLARHLQSQHPDKFPYSSKNNSRNSSYDQEISCKLLAELVTCGGLPLHFVENTFFLNWVCSLQPMYIPVKMENLKVHILEYFNKEKSRMSLELRKSSHINLTFHTCSSRQYKYLAITAHHINDAFELIKVMIGFKQLPPDYTLIHIKSVVEKCFNDWKIGNNILSSTSSKHTITELTTAFHPHFKKDRFIQCCSELINNMIRNCLFTIDKVVESIRRIVRSLNIKYIRKEFHNQDATDEQNSLVNSIPLDDVSRWDSTFQMLRAALSYKKDLDTYAYDHLHKEYPDFYMLSTEDWGTVSSVVECMKTFYDAMKVFSSCKDCPASLFLKTLWEIWGAVSDEGLACDEMLNKLSNDMQIELKNYLANCNYKLLLVASVLDPSKNMAFVEFCYQEYCEKWSEVKVRNFAIFLQNLFNIYSEANKNQTACMAYEDTNTEEAGITNSSKKNVQQRFSQFKKQKMSDATLLELDTYLKEVVADTNDSFDVLHWWKSNSSRYPVLSKMARDFLAARILALPSEYAFCMDGRILDYVDDTGMNPEIVEAVVCCKHLGQSSFDDDSSSQYFSNSSVLMVE